MPVRAVTVDFVNKSNSPRISDIDQPTISNEDVLVRISYAEFAPALYVVAIHDDRIAAC